MNVDESVCVRVFVCADVRERERERELAGLVVRHSLSLPVLSLVHSIEGQLLYVANAFLTSLSLSLKLITVMIIVYLV